MVDKYIDKINGIYIQDKELKNNVLEKDNNDEYIPVEDYNPATKRYVDTTTLGLINDNDKMENASYSSNKIDDMIGVIQKTLLNILGIPVPASISVVKYPDKTSYYEGDYFEPDGIELELTFDDGSTQIVSDVNDIIISLIPLKITDTSATFKYSYYGAYYYITVPITVNEFNKEFSLIDFNFIDNGNDTYTLTEWKGTLNGIPSTELVIPNNSKIIL